MNIPIFRTHKQQKATNEINFMTLC